MKKIRMYLLFTSWRYKLGMFLGLPAAALALGALWRGSWAVMGYGNMLAIELIFFEVMTDQAVFAGIQTKRGYKLDYLKTSPQGYNMLRWGLTGDLVRKLLTASLCVSICGGMGVLREKSGFAGAVGVLLAIYFAETLTLFISRYTQSAILCVWIAYGGLVFGVILCNVIHMIPARGIWLADILLALAATAVSVQAVRIAMKKWRRTYSDM